LQNSNIGKKTRYDKATEKKIANSLQNKNKGRKKKQSEKATKEERIKTLEPRQRPALWRQAIALAMELVFKGQNDDDIMQKSFSATTINQKRLVKGSCRRSKANRPNERS